MAKRGKRMRESLAVADLKAEYDPREGLKILRSFKGARFDEAVEVAMRLNIDPKHADQNIRGSVSLPNGLGSTKRVIAFVPDGEAVAEATQAGAIEVGGEEMVKKIQDGWFEFDVAIAHPQMMRVVGKLGRLLGPKGLMPSPKSGTVTDKIGEAVKDFAAGKVEFRSDSTGNIHAPVGKMSFDDEALIQNIQAFISHIASLRPASVKGQYIKQITMAATMSPAVRIRVA